MADCWKCGAERARVAFCPICGIIQPVVPNTSYFEVLGLHPAMTLDRESLDRAYRDLSRRVHPDRFGQESPLERRLALEQTTLMNDAHRTLKRPRQRAEYLLSLRGRKVGAEEDRVRDMAFLSEMMELREVLEESPSREEVEPLRREIAGRVEVCLSRLAEIFDHGRGSDEDAARALEQLRFLERFLDEVETRFET